MKPAESNQSHESPEASAAGWSVLDWPRRAGTVDGVLSELKVRDHRRQRRRTGLLAFAAGAFVGVGLLWRWQQTPAPSNNSVMSLVVVAAAHQTLPDGSTVDLKDGAQIEVTFTPEVRAVTLRRGMARFQVAKNPHRPFVVTADDVSVRAVGTAFCVDLGAKSVEVIVTEGRVSVAQSTPAAAAPAGVTAPALVGAGEHVVVAPFTGTSQPPALTVAPLAALELTHKLTWLNPRLEFTGTPLEMVVMTFNQHNRRQLVLESPELRNLQLSGILRSDNIPALLHMLETNFRIQIKQRGNDEILLRKAP